MEYDARGNVTEYIDGRKTKFVREYTKTDLLKREEAFTVKEDDNNYKSTPDASRSYEHDNLNRITSVLLCLNKPLWTGLAECEYFVQITLHCIYTKKSIRSVENQVFNFPFSCSLWFV